MSLTKWLPHWANSPDEITAIATSCAALIALLQFLRERNTTKICIKNIQDATIIVVSRRGKTLHVAEVELLVPRCAPKQYRQKRYIQASRNFLFHGKTVENGNAQEYRLDVSDPIHINHPIKPFNRVAYVKSKMEKPIIPTIFLRDCSKPVTSDNKVRARYPLHSSQTLDLAKTQRKRKQ